MQSRRDFLKNCGALIVSFSAGSLLPLASAEAAQQATGQHQGAFPTHPSHIDPSRLDSWLAVDASGNVTAFTGKCDFGQGMYTAQTQLVAEELCVPLARVKLVECDTAVTPDQGSTSGSQSTPTNFNDENLALAAATAREAFLHMAAEKFHAPLDQLSIAGGVITSSSGQRITYGELVGTRRLDLPLSATARRRPSNQWTVLGQPVPSLDRVALMTGQFEFLHSIRVPGMLHGRVVRPPQMGATVSGVDENSVRQIPGLVKVVVRKNFVGVVAETQYAAMQAARQLTVQWRPGPALPPQDSFFLHLQQQPSHDVLSVDSRDVDAKLAGTHQLVSARYTYPFQMHGSVGTSCAVADVTPQSATVWSATQSLYPTRSVVATLLDMPLDNVRVIYAAAPAVMA